MASPDSHKKPLPSVARLFGNFAGRRGGARGSPSALRLDLLGLMIETGMAIPIARHGDRGSRGYSRHSSGGARARAQAAAARCRRRARRNARDRGRNGRRRSRSVRRDLLRIISAMPNRAAGASRSSPPALGSGRVQGVIASVVGQGCSPAEIRSGVLGCSAFRPPKRRANPHIAALAPSFPRPESMFRSTTRISGSMAIDVRSGRAIVSTRPTVRFESPTPDRNDRHPAG